MFTCQAIKNGGTYLSKHLSANDYYSKDEQVLGVWVGKGAERLGIAGREIGAKDAAFEMLRTNRHPLTGEPLTGHSRSARRAFYDFQCSAPKSVSVMAVTYGDDRLVQAHKQAVLIAMEVMEKYAARQDNTKNADGSWSRGVQITGNIVAAAFTHDANRELEAQLHTHLVTVNATFDEKTGRWYALENCEMYGAIALFGRVYQGELAQIVQALGYEIVEDRENGVVKGFEIVGVTIEDREIQSTRRAQIEEAAEEFKKERGLVRNLTAAEMHVLATQTREKNLAEITTPEVRAKQLAKYSVDDRARLQKVVENAKQAVRSGTIPERDRGAASEAIEYAAEHLLDRKAVVTRKDVLTFALQENLGAVTFKDLRNALDHSPTVVQLTADGTAQTDTARITSVAQLEREKDSVRIVEALSRKSAPLERRASLAPSLANDQRQAVTQFLKSTDGVYALLGRAGAGKTHTLREMDRVVRIAGLVPLYVAPSHAAKEVLQENGFKDADTVSKLLILLKTGEVSLKGRLLIVDEAGMLSTKQGAELLRAVEKAGARTLLVGDDKQLTSVQAGDWLGMLLRHAKLSVSVLHEIRRQKNELYREAIMDMSKGNVRDGLAKLAKQGWVHEGKAAYLAAAAQSWLKRDSEKESAILIAPTWAEIDKLNELVRIDLSERGTLTGKETVREVMDLTDYTPAQRKVAKNYTPGLYVAPATRVPGLKKGEWTAVKAIDKKKGQIVLTNGTRINVRRYGAALQVARNINIGIRTGDTLMLQGNEKKLGLINGERVTVLRPEADGGLRVRQDRRKGKELVLPKNYKTYVHGYAVTVYKGQGVTVKHNILAAARMDGREIYVGTSRGEKTVEVHVPDTAAILRGTKNSIDPLEAALDHAKAKERTSPPPLPPRTNGREKLRAFVEHKRTQLVRAAHFARGHLSRLVERTRGNNRNSQSNSIER